MTSVFDVAKYILDKYGASSPDAGSNTVIPKEEMMEYYAANR